MQRTTSRYEFGRFHHTSGRALWIRPTFRLESGALVREAAADYPAFVAAQRELIEGEFDGSRSRRRATSFLPRLFAQWRAALGTGADAPAAPAARVSPAPAGPEVSLRVIEELARQVKSRGGRSILVDADAYFTETAALSEILRTLCQERGIGHVPLDERLRESNRVGRATRWEYDGHFNEAGNQVFADAMYEWVRENSARLRLAARRPTLEPASRLGPSSLAPGASPPAARSAPPRGDS